jgi:rubrerythrin
MDADQYKKIIKNAINKEVEAYTFYRTVADKVRDTTLKNMFGELAGEEKKHRELLEDFLTKDVKEMHFNASRDYKVADSLETTALTPDMKPLDGLVLAIRRELEAMQMYSQLAALSDDAPQKKLFTELASMERGHKARLEDIYTNMAFPESW